MKSTSLEKMQKAAKVLLPLLKLGLVLTVGMSLFILVMSGVNLYMIADGQMVGRPDFYTAGPLEFELMNTDHMATLPAICLGMAMAAVNLVAMIYIYPQAKRILEGLQAGKPFTSQISQKLHKIAFAVLVSDGLISVLRYVEATVWYQRLHLETALLNENVVHCVFKPDFSLTFLFAFIAIMMLSWVFHYGETLEETIR